MCATLPIVQLFNKLRLIHRSKPKPKAELILWIIVSYFFAVHPLLSVLEGKIEFVGFLLAAIMQWNSMKTICLVLSYLGGG